MKNGIRVIVLAVILSLFTVVFAAADPAGPTSISAGTTSRYDLSTTGGGPINAYAGNVTRLDINGTSITTGWQGYFGNVLGTIVLGDSSNNTIYDWSLSSPGGEIYAVRAQASITWANVNCSNATTMAAEESTLNFGTAADGINETFTAGAHTQFYVGQNAMNNCPYTTLHNSTGQNTADWEEVLLSDGTNLVYASLVNNNADGFDGTSYDFQMIVAEDGHSGDTTVASYYFWTELE